MSLRDIDMTSAMRRLADRRIEEAMREGKFDNLKGAGKPLELEPMPAEESARMTWWMLRILKHNDVIPEEVTWRKQVELLRGRLTSARSEDVVRALVKQINDLAFKLATLGTNALPSDVTSLDVEAEVARFRERMQPRQR